MVWQNTYLKSFTTLWSKRILVKLFVKNCSFTNREEEKIKGEAQKKINK